MKLFLKKTILTLVALFMCEVMFAVEVEINGISYDVIKKANIATLLNVKDKNKVGNFAIPEFVTYEGEKCYVTTIGASAFANCKLITAVSIPNTVTQIKSSAFSDCLALKSILIPNSVTSMDAEIFKGCKNLATVVLSNMLTSIERETFSGCESLKSVNIPNSVTYFGVKAFENCKALPTLILPNALKIIEGGTFRNCASLDNVTIPNKVALIKERAFEGCMSLKNLIFPNSVSYIYQYAFYNCSSLETIKFWGVMETIGDYAFANCTSLKTVTLPESVNEVGDHAFASCSKLTTITIPKYVKYISSNAFKKCEEIKDVYYFPELCSVNSTMFEDSHVEYATLHAPSKLMPFAKTVEALNGFGKFVLTDGDGQKDIQKDITGGRNITDELRELIVKQNKSNGKQAKKLWQECVVIKGDYLVFENYCFDNESGNNYSYFSESDVLKRKDIMIRNMKSWSSEDKLLLQELVRNKLGIAWHIDGTYSGGKLYVDVSYRELAEIVQGLE